MKRFEVNMSNNKKEVIIKGMKIPKNCFKCDFRDGLTCMAADQKEIDKKKRKLLSDDRGRR